MRKTVQNLLVLLFMILLLGSSSEAVAAELSDGTYEIEVSLSGGSGRASLTSPTSLTVSDGKMTVTVQFSSPYYDYMKIGDTRYEPINEEGDSTFEIPVEDLSVPLAVIADTTAMSEPHEIEYEILFTEDSIVEAGAAEKAADTETENSEAEETETEKPYAEENEADTTASEESEAAEPAEIAGLTFNHRMELHYAKQFTVDYYEGGYALITIGGTDRFLLVPEGASAPDGLGDEIVVLQKPLANMYLAATSAMDFFAKLDGMSALRLSGTKQENWYVEEAAAAMEAGELLYAGKYNAPDYEQMLASGCSLAIESTMIYHNPEVKENLESFGIPVMVERSSYEEHPLGREEWIRLYAVLLDKEEEAEQFFDSEMKKIESLTMGEQNASVAFFSMNSKGMATVRKSSDYVAKMIGLAGGKYIFDDLGEDDSAVSTVTMQMEEFYAGAKDADFIIYNSTIEGEVDSIDVLLSKNPLLAEFQAVQNKKVFCTSRNLFQKTTGLADLIVDIHTMLASDDPASENYTYLKPVN
ncbi:MAG: ABC transporter substrate-binding protein [Eubacteriales bacterium]|nr:ABC transporter substrate-binding protein [Eubacteriales bacterium]